MKSWPGIIVLAVVAVCWGGVQLVQGAANDERATWPKVEEYVVLPSPETAPAASLGYRQLMADITWARLLVYYGSAHIGKSDFRYMQQFADNIIALDPQFKRVYRWAAYSMTHQQGYATQQEFHDSIKYLELGIKAFPDNYEMYWLAGMRYWLDLQADDDPEQERAWRERGAELIEIAMRKPDAPDTLATLAATIRTKLGQRERAKADLREMVLTTDNKKARQTLLDRIVYLDQSTDEADELERFRETFDAAWHAEIPFAPAHWYVLLGDRSSTIIDLDDLATDRDLFGVEADADAAH
jgi:hypothetical protein